MNQNLSQVETDIHKKFVEQGSKRKILTECLLGMLRKIEKMNIYKKLGYKDIYEYGRIHAGLSNFAITQAIRINKRTENISEFENAVEKIGINKAELISRVAKNGNASFLIKEAKNLSYKALKTVVKEIKFKDRNNSADIIENQIHKAKTAMAASENLKINLNNETLKVFKRLKKKLNINTNNESSLEIILQKMEETLEENEILKKTTRDLNMRTSSKTALKQKEAKKEKNEDVLKNIKTKASSRYIPEQIKNQIIKRSKGTCEYPNCTNTKDVLHHTDRFAKSKSHENLVALCNTHHEIIHSKLILNEHSKIKNWELMEENLEILQPDHKFIIDQKFKNFRQNKINKLTTNSSPP